MKKLPFLLGLLLAALFLIDSKTSYCQSAGPEPQWIKQEYSPTTWSGVAKPDPSDPAFLQSDEWWYAHIKIYDINGTHIGYAAAGYSTWSDANVPYATQNNCFRYTNPNQKSLDCEAFELTTEMRGELFQTIARYDLDGVMLWCKRFNHDTFLNLIQDSQGDIIAIGQTKYVNDANGVSIKYNPTTGFSGYSLDCQAATPNYKVKMNVVKVNLNGTTLFNHIYGVQDGTFANANNWINESSTGHSLLEFDGGYRLVGRTTNTKLVNGVPGI